MSSSVDFSKPVDKRTEHSQGEVGEANVVEHKITVAELEDLKQEIGIYTLGENYSTKVGVFGTGWRPPTEEEWNKLASNGYVVEMISFDGSTPSFVDHSEESWFPPIGNQHQEGSCTCWAVGYYMKTYQEAKEHAWDLSGTRWDGVQPTLEYQDRIISPAFIYNLVNGGVDHGSSPIEAIGLICSIGASSWEKMPYNAGDYATWPNEEAWREATLYRGASSGYHCMYIANETDLAYLKNWIALGNVAATNLDASKIYYLDILGFPHSRLTSNDVLTLDSYAPPFDYSSWHELTIVGYDDTFSYTEQGQTHFGAFKIANSWGVGGGWENVPDGYFWISYDTMKQWIHTAEYCDDIIGYVPKLAASFRITHSKRGECTVVIGVGSQTKNFDTYISGGDRPFCSNDIVVDISEFEDPIPDVLGQRFCLVVYDGGSSATGTIEKFAVEYTQSSDTPLNTVNNNSVTVYATLLHLETNWKNGELVSSDSDRKDNRVSMATDSNGYLYIAHEDWYPPGVQYGIFVEKSIDGGNSWFTLTNWYWAGYDCHNPSIAIDPYDDRIYVAYERAYLESDHDIYCMIYSQSNGEIHKVVSAASGDDRYPSITSEYQYGSSNYQYISYEYIHDYNDRDLIFAKSTDHGATWSTCKLHGDFPDYSVYTHTSITNAEGYLYIAYKFAADYDSPGEIRVDRSIDYGNSWSQFADIDGLSNGCSFPSITATHGGSTVMVAFQYDFSGTDIDVWYSYSVDRGNTWTKGKMLFGSTLENERQPALTVDGGGKTENGIFGCFYAVCRSGSYAKFRKTRYNDPMGWTSPTLVSSTWIGKGLAIVTGYRNVTAEFHPYIGWSDCRTGNVYCSTVGEVHNLNTGLRYTTIQQAINVNETLDNHVILVESRSYHESLVVNKSLVLTGENEKKTVIDAWSLYGYTDDAATVTASNVVLKDFTLTHGLTGILIRGFNVTILNNIITCNRIGIDLAHTSDNFILGNNVTENSQIGIYILYSSSSTFRRNRINANKYGLDISGDDLSEYIHDIDISNTINEKPIYYLVNVRDLRIDNVTHPNMGFLGIVNSTNVVIQNLNLRDNYQGLLLAYTNNSLIEDNNLTNNNGGVWLAWSSSNVLKKNNAASNEFSGIVLECSFNNTCLENSFEENAYSGVSLVYSDFNRLYHNNFADNLMPIHSFESSTNLWDDDYPSGGNYWDSYVGVDLFQGVYQNETGGDGIGDTPYVADADNADHYPLMNPWIPSDAAVIDVVPSKTVVGQGFTMDICVTVQNQGNKIESFNVSVLVNSTPIASKTLLLAGGNYANVNFIWNTTNFGRGNYTIAALVELVQEETDTQDNSYVSAILVHSGIPGDVTGLIPDVYDGRVDVRDVTGLIIKFCARPGNLLWHPNYDVNNDGVINVRDITIAILNFYQHE
jgi:parallel beta-helix repeat protein